MADRRMLLVKVTTRLGEAEWRLGDQGGGGRNGVSLREGSS